MLEFDFNRVAKLPENYSIRQLHHGDYDRGVFRILEQLAPIGEIPRIKFARYLNYLDHHKQMHTTVVVLNGSDNVVGIGTLVLEPKL